MDKEQVLQSFGLTEAEVRLYVTLLTSGEATASELAKRTDTNRTFTYDRLKKLLGSGLASYVVKDSKKYFKAAEPGQLLAMLEEKQEQVRAVLPDLEKLRAPPHAGPDVKVFSSKNGVRAALNLVLKEGQSVYVHGTMARFREIMGSFYEIWDARRVKGKIPLKILSNEEVRMELAEMDVLPEEERSSITTFTFGNKVIIVLWADVPVAIHIESGEIAKDTVSFFNAIWNREIRIYSGVDGILEAFFELVEKKSSVFLGIGYSRALAEVYGKRRSDEWHKVRLKNGILSRVISYDDKKSKDYFQARMRQWENFEVRFLGKDICGPACMTLSDHMIATFIYTEKSFKVIVNRNRETIAAYRKHFELLWEKAEKR
ncbi:TPA: TrmB family transcriptional regulator [Candidatus Woesearchaeota archaeon]|nr:MAG: hypothetical protein QT04_C0032G0001 [archaeon GW2011_AR11]MBS3111448.1 helix-turn-helix domain-containing protein [Candidatus Woesearchaeota archaeon]HII65863.1 TrmB family transcriptional regulator [Candidatus Woesearchaeota archaeon]